MSTEQNYPRDMVGYGAAPPDAQWPDRARIAVQFVMNYEEGGENCVLMAMPHPKRSCRRSSGHRRSRVCAI